MFEITRIFSNKENTLKITPILMNGEPMFFPQEIGGILGYSNLVNSIATSSGMIEDVDYQVVREGRLLELKRLSEIGDTNFAISPNQNSYTFKHAWSMGSKSGYNYKWNVAAISDRWEKLYY